MLNYPKRILYNLFTEEIYLFQPAYFSLGNKRVGKQKQQSQPRKHRKLFGRSCVCYFFKGAFDKVSSWSDTSFTTDDDDPCTYMPLPAIAIF